MNIPNLKVPPVSDTNKIIRTNYKRLRGLAWVLALLAAPGSQDEDREQALRERLFEPLALGSAGFGPPRSETDSLTEPRGHRHVLGMTLAASEKMKGQIRARLSVRIEISNGEYSPTPRHS